MKLVNIEKLNGFPLRFQYDNEIIKGLNIASGIEAVIAYANNLPVDFDMTMVLQQLEIK